MSTHERFRMSMSSVVELRLSGRMDPLLPRTARSSFKPGRDQYIKKPRKMPCVTVPLNRDLNIQELPREFSAVSQGAAGCSPGLGSIPAYLRFKDLVSDHEHRRVNPYRASKDPAASRRLADIFFDISPRHLKRRFCNRPSEAISRPPPRFKAPSPAVPNPKGAVSLR